jgi:hypothetical protein
MPVPKIVELEELVKKFECIAGIVAPKNGRG